MNEFTFGKQFIDFIKTVMPGSKEASGGSEMVCFCKYCQDSKDHGHMYIKVPQKDNDPILFHCFKCQMSGIVDSRTLIEWGIYDPIIGISLDTINNHAIKNQKYCGYTKHLFNIYNYVEDFDLANLKLNYLNNRLGTSLSIREWQSQKVIFNLKDVLKYNNIKSFTRHPSIVDQLNYNFIGFLSVDNNFVNMRRLCNEGIVYKSIDNRYVNYNIHGKYDTTEKMYILPTSIDLTTPQKINIHVAEGPFDILSIKYNLRHDDNHSIFAAITGSGYKGLVNHLINTMQLFYFDLHIYPDNDKYGSQAMIDELYYLIKPYGATLYEHRNTCPNEKDFGVSSNRIIENIYTYK